MKIQLPKDYFKKEFGKNNYIHASSITVMNHNTGYFMDFYEINVDTMRIMSDGIYAIINDILYKLFPIK